MKIVAYWGARTGIFLAVVGVLYLVGWFDIIAMIAAFIVAWLISYLVLPNLRREAGLQMEGVIDRSQKGLRSLDDEEDAEANGAVADGAVLNGADATTVEERPDGADKS